MSHSFDARFAPTELSLSEILVRLEPCLEESNIDFDGEIVRLHSRGGVPTVMSMDTHRVASLEEAAQVAESWFGLSLYCISRPLAEVLGRSDSIEVYLRIFKAPTGRMLVYNENSGAFRARTQSDALARDLAALLVRISAALELEFALYAEEEDEPSAPSLAELEHRLVEHVKSPRVLAWLAVVAASSMSVARARELAGPRKDRVRLSTSQYVVLPFLAD